MRFEKDFSVAYFQKENIRRSYLETITATVFLIFLFWYLRPVDAFFISGPIPWLSILSVFFSLFYGLTYGLLSLGIILSTAYLIELDQIDKLNFKEFSIGSLVLVCISGYVRSFWVARINHVEHLNEYLREHLEQLTREYYFLRISHDQIEQSYIFKPVSLRDVFFQIQEEIKANHLGSHSDPQTADMLLRVFSQFCSINRAAFTVFNQDTIVPISFLGQSFPIDKDDPLIHTALKKKKTAYTSVINLEEHKKSKYLAVIPLLDIHQRLIGLIIIHDLPFWSLTHEKLEVLMVIASYFCLKWVTLKSMEPLIKKFPKAPVEFLKELTSVVCLKKNYQVESSLVCMQILPGRQQDNIVFILEKQIRLLDKFWRFKKEEGIFLVILMPLTTLDGVLGFKKRINDMLKNNFSISLDDEQIILRFQKINENEPKIQVQDLLEETGYAAFI